MDDPEPGPDRTDDADLIDRTERWFLGRGIPHFIHDYRADEDILTRALPFLVLVAVVELVGAVDAGWSWWANVIVAAAALGAAAGAWALFNRLRGRRTWQRPDDVGLPELAFFVFVPPLVRAAVGSSAWSIGSVFAFNLGLVVVAYAVTSFGLIPMARWALGRTVQQVGAVAGLFGRAMPLLLLFSIALFINAEVWQVAASLDGALFWTASAFFLLVGTGFLVLRLPGEVARLAGPQDRDGVDEACRGTGVGDELIERLGAAPVLDPPPLSRRQRGNVLLVLLFSQAVQVLLITVGLTLFFFGFGLVAIRPEVIAAWLGDAVEPSRLAEWEWFGHRVVVTRALVHVAGLLGVMSGFYFTVYVITDATYREEFFEEILDQVRRSLAVRRLYLAVVTRSAG